MGAVAPTIMAVSAIVGAAATGYGAYQQFQAADEARDIADKNAKLARMEAEERAKRLEMEQERTRGRARAAAAASGVDVEGTPLLYLEEMEEIQREELDWLRAAGYHRAEVEEQKGEFAAQQAYQGAWGSIGGLFSQAPGIYEAGVKAKWWERPK